MEQKEFLEKVQREARKRVEARISVFREEIEEAFKKLLGKLDWFSFDKGDLRKQTMKAYFETKAVAEWPKVLYETEEQGIIDGLLSKEKAVKNDQ
jgi:hypothetical protein